LRTRTRAISNHSCIPEPIGSSGPAADGLCTFTFFWGNRALCPQRLVVAFGLRGGFATAEFIREDAEGAQGEEVGERYLPSFASADVLDVYTPFRKKFPKLDSMIIFL